MISCATTFQKRRKRLSAAFFWKTAASDRKWLNITDLDAVKPDPALFPGFNDQLRHDFSKEAEAFISSILLEDRSVIDLLTSNQTFLNERLAGHYGIPGITGNQFREVTLAEKERAGLLGKAA